MSEQFVGTMPVQERHRVDVGGLEAWLAANMPGVEGPLEVEQFKGGQSNPTYLLKTPAATHVLRRKPPGKLLPSAHAIEREYRVMNALRGSGVPVPQMHCLCDDTAVIGSAFYVMEHVQGRILWDPQLPGFSVAERRALFDDMNRVIAALHRLDPAQIGLADYGKPGNFFARQIGRWSAQYRASETERIEAMERLIEWLPLHIPASETAALVHGDFRLDNLVFHAWWRCSTGSFPRSATRWPTSRTTSSPGTRQPARRVAWPSGPGSVSPTPGKPPTDKSQRHAIFRP